MNAMLSRLEGSRRRQQRFVSDSSHELRSPLASLRQSAEVARAHPDALPEGELADTVFEETVRMQRLVDQMLLLTRTDEGDTGDRRREVDLDDLARTEAAGCATGWRSTLRGWSTGGCCGDELALGQVVRNLLDNAARHAQGRVEVAVHRDGTPGGAHRGRRRRRYPGGPAGAGLRAVRPARRGPRRDAGGSGLGLAIVREIARAHGGEAAVSASALGGVRFSVSPPGCSLTRLRAFRCVQVRFRDLAAGSDQR